MVERLRYGEIQEQRQPYDEARSPEGQPVHFHCVHSITRARESRPEAAGVVFYWLVPQFRSHLHENLPQPICSLPRINAPDPIAPGVPLFKI